MSRFTLDLCHRIYINFRPFAVIFNGMMVNLLVIFFSYTKLWIRVSHYIFFIQFRTGRGGGLIFERKFTALQFFDPFNDTTLMQSLWAIKQIVFKSCSSDRKKMHCRFYFQTFYYVNTRTTFFHMEENNLMCLNSQKIDG